jgi:hypothetical protein
MKRNPGVSKVYGLMMVIAVALLIQACAQFVVTIEHGVFGLMIRRPVPIKNENALAIVLKKLKKPGVKYHFHLVRENGTSRDFDFDSGVKIKTDRVVMTEVGQSLSKEGLTPIGASLTHHLYASDPGDIAKVLGQIKSTD